MKIKKTLVHTTRKIRANKLILNFKKFYIDYILYIVNILYKLKNRII